MLNFEAKNKGDEEGLSVPMVSSQHKVHELNNTPSNIHANNFCDIGIFHQYVLSKSGAPKPQVTQLGKNPPKKIEKGKATGGKIHSYLGMKLDDSEKGKSDLNKYTRKRSKKLQKRSK